MYKKLAEVQNKTWSWLEEKYKNWDTRNKKFFSEKWSLLESVNLVRSEANKWIKQNDKQTKRHRQL